MPNALSNPYELTVNGVSCKCSPYGQGSYIDAGDLEKLGEEADKFKADIKELYDADFSHNPKTKTLDGIKVYGRKPEVKHSDVRQNNKIS